MCRVWWRHRYGNRHVALRPVVKSLALGVSNIYNAQPRYPYCAIFLSFMFVHYNKTTKAMNFCLNKTRTSLRKYEVGCECGIDASSTTLKLCTAYRMPLSMFPEIYVHNATYRMLNKKCQIDGELVLFWCWFQLSLCCFDVGSSRQ